MSEADEIQNVVAELNRTRHNVVKNVTEFVKHGNIAVENEKSKQQSNSSEKIAVIVQKAHQDTSKTVPELKVGTAPLKPTVKIKEPIANAPFTEGNDIPLKFKVTNVKPPFMYKVMGKEKTGSPFAMFVSRSDKLDVELKSIKRENKYPLTVGEYTIRVELISQGSHNVIDADKVDIKVTPKSPVPNGHTIDIVSPTGKNSPYTQPLAVEFKVGGPHHDAGKEFTYTMFVTRNGVRAWEDGGLTNHKDVIHANKIDGLPGGEYVIEITTTDRATGNVLKTVKESFVIKTGGPGPVNIINNIIINNNITNNITNNVTLPFVMPLNIKFELVDPKYTAQFTSHPLDIHIEVINNDSGKTILNKNDVFMEIGRAHV
jgi:hypothetical protein